MNVSLRGKATAALLSATLVGAFFTITVPANAETPDLVFTLQGTFQMVEPEDGAVGQLVALPTYLELEGGSYVALTDAPTDVEPGAVVEMQLGLSAEQAVQVEANEDELGLDDAVADAVAPEAPAHVWATRVLTSPPGLNTNNGRQHSIYVAVADFPGHENPLSLDEARARADRVAAYWSDQLGGVAEPFEVKKVFRLPLEDVKCDNWVGAGGEANKLLGAEKLSTEANHVVVITPTSCGVGGVAFVGNINSGNLMHVSSRSTDFSWNHELGHTLGLGHANIALCDDRDACPTASYGDFFSVMGATIKNVSPAIGGAYFNVMSAVQSGDQYRVPPDGRSHDITISAASSSAAGPRFAIAQDSVTDTRYVLDYRDGTGVDTDSAYMNPRQTSTVGGERVRLGTGVRIVRLESGRTTTLMPSASPDRDTGQGLVYYGARQPGDTPFVSRGGSVRVDVLRVGDGSATVRISSAGQPPLASDLHAEPALGESATLRPNIQRTNSAVASIELVDPTTGEPSSEKSLVSAGSDGSDDGVWELDDSDVLSPQITFTPVLKAQSRVVSLRYQATDVNGASSDYATVSVLVLGTGVTSETDNGGDPTGGNANGGDSETPEVPTGQGANGQESPSVGSNSAASGRSAVTDSVQTAAAREHLASSGNSQGVGAIAVIFILGGMMSLSARSLRRLRHSR